MCTRRRAIAVYSELKQPKFVSKYQTLQLTLIVICDVFANSKVLHVKFKESIPKRCLFCLCRSCESAKMRDNIVSVQCLELKHAANNSD